MFIFTEGSIQSVYSKNSQNLWEKKRLFQRTIVGIALRKFIVEDNGVQVICI